MNPVRTSSVKNTPSFPGRFPDGVKSPDIIPHPDIPKAPDASKRPGTSKAPDASRLPDASRRPDYDTVEISDGARAYQTSRRIPADTFVPDTALADAFAPDTVLANAFAPDTVLANAFCPDVALTGSSWTDADRLDFMLAGLGTMPDLTERLFTLLYDSGESA